MSIIVNNKVDIARTMVKLSNWIPAYHENLFQHVYLSQIEHANIDVKNVSCHIFYWYATTAPQLHMGEWYHDVGLVGELFFYYPVS
jgi:hypothetical protein